MARHPYRLRAALLGCQPQRVVRAAFLLRGLCFAGALSPRSSAFPHGTDWHPHGIFWRVGMVSAGVRGDARRPHGLPPCAFAGLSNPELCLLPVGLAGGTVARTCPRHRATGCPGGIRVGPPRAGSGASQAQRGRHHRSRLEGKRSFHRILHLLHAGEYRRRGRPLRRVLRASAAARRERLSRCGAERVPDVPCRFAVLPGAAPLREVQTGSLSQAARNFWTVITNPRFMLFLLIFTGYWIVYWQEFITLPIYVHDYINPHTDTELLLVTGPLVVIALTLAINIATQRIRAFSAIIIGTLVTALAWIILIV